MKLSTLSIFETTLLHETTWQTLAFPEAKHNFISPLSFFRFNTKHQRAMLRAILSAKKMKTLQIVG